MGRASVDYRVIEQEYVTTDVSYRDLESKYKVSFSAIATYGRNHDWPMKRNAYRDSLKQKAIARIQDKDVALAADVREESIAAMRATVYKYLEQLKDGQVNVSTKDAAIAIEKLLLLTGEVTERREERHVVDGVSIAGLEPAELKELLALSRARIVSGSVGESP